MTPGPGEGDDRQSSDDPGEASWTGEGRAAGALGDGVVDRLTGLVLLACVLFNPPVLRAFGGSDVFLGLPLVYVYLFAVWGAVIFMTARLLDRRGGG